MLHRVTKFQRPPPKRLSAVVKSILGDIMPPPPMSNRVKLNSFRNKSVLQLAPHIPNDNLMRGESKHAQLGSIFSLIQPLVSLKTSLSSATGHQFS